jgi:hypothetical protein
MQMIACASDAAAEDNSIVGLVSALDGQHLICSFGGDAILS